MMRELLRSIVDNDMVMSLRRRDDTIRTTVAQWDEAHGQPIDRSELGLFLCDENYGDLTDEQCALALQCKADMGEIYDEMVFRLLQYALMQRRNLVRDFADYNRILMSDRPTGGGQSAKGDEKRKQDKDCCQS